MTLMIYTCSRWHTPVFYNSFNKYFDTNHLQHSKPTSIIFLRKLDILFRTSTGKGLKFRHESFATYQTNFDYFSEKAGHFI